MSPFRHFSSVYSLFPARGVYKEVATPPSPEQILAEMEAEKVKEAQKATQSNPDEQVQKTQETAASGIDRLEAWHDQWQKEFEEAIEAADSSPKGGSQLSRRELRRAREVEGFKKNEETGKLEWGKMTAGERSDRIFGKNWRQAAKKEAEQFAQAENWDPGIQLKNEEGRIDLFGSQEQSALDQQVAEARTNKNQQGAEARTNKNQQGAEAATREEEFKNIMAQVSPLEEEAATLALRGDQRTKGEEAQAAEPESPASPEANVIRTEVAAYEAKPPTLEQRIRDHEELFGEPYPALDYFKTLGIEPRNDTQSELLKAYFKDSQERGQLEVISLRNTQALLSAYISYTEHQLGKGEPSSPKQYMNLRSGVLVATGKAGAIAVNERELGRLIVFALRKPQLAHDPEALDKELKSYRRIG